MVFGCIAAFLIHALSLTLATLGGLFILALFLCLNENFHSEKRFEAFSGLWTLGLYLNLGIIPFLL